MAEEFAPRASHRVRAVDGWREPGTDSSSRSPAAKRVTRYRARNSPSSAVTADVTERKRAEQLLATEAERMAGKLAQAMAELSDTRERLEALSGASNQAVWVADAEGQVTEDSPSWRVLAGQTLPEWLGSGWIDAVHPEDRGDVQRQWRNAVERRSPIDTRFRLWHAATRTRRYSHVRAIPLRHDDGTVRGWLGLHTDLADAAGLG